MYDFDDENFGGAGGEGADDKSKVKSLAAKRSQQVSDIITFCVLSFRRYNTPFIEDIQ